MSKFLTNLIVILLLFAFIGMWMVIKFIEDIISKIKKYIEEKKYSTVFQIIGHSFIRYMSDCWRSQ